MPLHLTRSRRHDPMKSNAAWIYRRVGTSFRFNRVQYAQFFTENRSMLKGGCAGTSRVSEKSFEARGDLFRRIFRPFLHTDVTKNNQKYTERPKAFSTVGYRMSRWWLCRCHLRVRHGCNCSSGVTVRPCLVVRTLHNM